MSTTTYPQPSEAVAGILNRVQGVRRSGAGWSARCPSHEDRQPSLSIALGEDGKALLKCHAGCATDQIVAALGLSARDLFEAEPVQLPARRPSEPLAPRNGAGGPALFVIRNAAGEPVALHERTDGPTGKRMTWRLPDGSPGLNGLPAAELPLYGSEHVTRWDASRPVYLVEGEKAALAMLRVGLRAVATVTGAAGTPEPEPLDVLRGHHVIAWPDADDQGRAHMERIAERLEGVAASVRRLEWPEAPAGGDAADLLAIGTVADVEQLTAAAPLVSAPQPLRLDAMVTPPNIDAWTVEGLFRPGQLAVLAAPIGLGKSQARTSIGMQVAAGEGLVVGHYAVRLQANVLVIDEENGPAEEWRRDEAHLAYHGLQRAGLPYHRLSHAGVMLDQPAWLARVGRWVDELEIGLLILDAISAMHTRRELREDLLPIYHGLRRLMDAHPALTVLLVHHLKKLMPNARASERGLDDLRGALWGQVADVAIIMSPLPERRIKWEVHKRVPHSELILAPSEAGPLELVTDKVHSAQRVKSDDRVLAYVDAGAATVPEVVLASGLAERTVWDAVRRLRSAGLLQPKGDLRRSEDDR